jgi:glyoxylase-like metal-dependent hydrolase (beta-lactamase superfamily II)
LGYIEGQDGNFGPPGIKNMSSDRWASIRKHQRLLNPHLILRDILANPSLAAEGGEVLFDGSVHHLVVVEDEVAPLTLYINAGTGRIAKLTTMENDALRRDVPLEIFYYSWQPIGQEGFFFPAELYIAYDGDIVHKEIRTAIEVNPEMDSALFEFPAEAAPVFDAELAARGQAHHQYLQNFAAYGFPRDGLQAEVTAAELAPGVFHLTGGSHHSLVIEQAEGIVVVEAPLDETRSQAVINWIKTTFPDKPISHVVSSHHHVDHSAGLRTYVAEGATIVMGETAKPFFEEIFLANSTIVPDPLADNPMAATIETAPADGSFTIPDAAQPVEVYPIENSHAESMVITYVPEAGVVFVSDLYNPNPDAPDPGPGAVVLNERMTELGLNVATIAGGHGGTITFEAFEDLLGQ